MRKATKLIIPVRLTMWSVTTVMILLLGMSPQASAQFKVGDNPTDVHPAAALQVESTNQGVLLPRVNDTAATPLPLSPDGMIVYFTDAGNGGADAGLYVRKNGSWHKMEAAGNSWSLIGNAGTDPSENFIGTTDNQPLQMRANDTRIAILHPNNLSLGASAMDVANGTGNIALGNQALGNADNLGNNNTAVGTRSLRKTNGILSNTPQGNTAVGSYALEDNEDGSYNTAVGDSALAINKSGTHNTAIGTQSGVSAGNLSYTTAIGYNARVAKSNAIVLGDTASNDLYIGIGRSTPEAKLHIYATAGNNPMKLEGLPSGGTTDSLLTVSGDGVVGKKTVNSVISATAWSLTGNTGVTAGHSIGTLNDYPLHFTVNGNRAGFISGDGDGQYRNTSIGYRSLPETVTGYDNSAFGMYALNGVTAGERNTATGSHALFRNTTGLDNTAVGNDALRENTGSGNTAVGSSALTSNTGGNLNVAVGQGAMATNETGNSNIAVGWNALTNSVTGNGNVAVGDQALTNNISGIQNIALGISALYNNNTGNNNVAIGPFAMFTTSGASYSNVAVGPHALYNNTTGSNNISLGVRSASSNTTGGSNIAIGDSALSQNASGNYNIAIGRRSGTTAPNLSSAVAIGDGARVARSNAMVLGDTSDNNFNVGIGRSTPQAKLHVRATAGNNPLMLEGVPTASAADSILTINNTTGVVGKRTIGSLISGGWNLTGNSGTTPSHFIGTTDANHPLRFQAEGWPAGELGAQNTIFGYRAMVDISSGTQNVAIGTQALMYNMEGSNNIGIGHLATSFPTNLNYAIAIGSNTIVRRSNSMVLGDTTINDFNVGIGRSTPQAKLHIKSTTGNNPLILEGLPSGGAGDSLLTVNANGIVGKKTVGSMVSATAWSLTGNTGTTAGTHFIGTADNQDIVFKRNNVFSGRIGDKVTALGNMAGINTSTGVSNLAIGDRALQTNIGGQDNTAVGANALSYNTASYNTALGNTAMNRNNTGIENTALGNSAMYWSVSGHQNTAVGNAALMRSQSGTQNTAVGFQAQLYNSTGHYNTALGTQALQYSANGSYNTGVGFRADVTDSNLNLSYATAIGAHAKVARSRSVILGDTTDALLYVGIGRSTPEAKLHIRATGTHRPLIMEGTPAGAATDSVLTINAATGVVGQRAATDIVSIAAWTLTGNSGTDTTHNFIGTTDNMPLSMKVNNERAGIISERNTAIGYMALSKNQRDGLNTAIGIEALKNNTDGAWNEAIGYQAMVNNTTGNYNVAVGALALMSNVAGRENAVFGHQAATSVTGSGNTALGAYSLQGNTTGTDNTVIGRGANVASGNLTNAVAIGAGAVVAQSHAILLGRAVNDTVGVGIGTASPLARMHIRGVSWNPPLLMEGVPSGAASDSVLTINASTGVVGKRPVAAVVGSAVWGLTGNSGTTPSQFIGTTDTAALRFRTNNIPSGIVSGANTSLGYGALLANGAGWGNVAFGSATLSENVTGNGNTAMGVNALLKTTASYNTAMGHDAMKYNVSGVNNIGIGSEAVRGSTAAGGISGNFNVGIGGGTLLSLSTGSNNTAIGHAALRSNTTGSGNVGIGSSTLYSNTSGVGNLALGDRALYSNSTGGLNVALGYQALYSNTSGPENVAMGNSALFSNTTGAGNVAIGTNAMRANTIGNDNLAIGNQSNWLNQTGQANVSVGSYSLNNNSGGAANTAIGFRALDSNTTGGNNVAVGHSALQNNKTGSNNTALGHGANVSAGNLTNATAIGYNAVVNASNKVRIGNSSVTVIEGQVAWSFPSDARFKDNVRPDVPGLALIRKLTPVTYNFNSRRQEAHTTGKPVADNASYQAAYQKLHTGFLAQDVEAVCKELGFEFDAVNTPENERDHYSLSYSQFIMPLVKAVQEQQGMIEQQQADNIALKQQLETQQKTLELLLKRLEQLEGR